MSRPIVSAALVTALAWAGPAQGQLAKPLSAPPAKPATSPATSAPTAPPSTAPAPNEENQLVTVAETNRPAEKCVVLQTWRLPDGTPAMKVKSLESGEVMTITAPDQASNNKDRFRVFRWGKSQAAPKGTPIPPEVVFNTPAKETKVPAAGAQAPTGKQLGGSEPVKPVTLPSGMPSKPTTSMTGKPATTTAAAPAKEEKPSFFSRFRLSAKKDEGKAKVPLVKAYEPTTKPVGALEASKTAVKPAKAVDVNPAVPPSMPAVAAKEKKVMPPVEAPMPPAAVAKAPAAPAARTPTSKKDVAPSMPVDVAKAIAEIHKVDGDKLKSEVKTPVVAAPTKTPTVVPAVATKRSDEMPVKVVGISAKSPAREAVMMPAQPVAGEGMPLKIVGKAAATPSSESVKVLPASTTMVEKPTMSEKPAQEVAATPSRDTSFGGGQVVSKATPAMPAPPITVIVKESRPEMMVVVREPRPDPLANPESYSRRGQPGVEEAMPQALPRPSAPVVTAPAKQLDMKQPVAKAEPVMPSKPRLVLPPAPVPVMKPESTVVSGRPMMVPPASQVVKRDSQVVQVAPTIVLPPPTVQATAKEAPVMMKNPESSLAPVPAHATTAPAPMRMEMTDERLVTEVPVPVPLMPLTTPGARPSVAPPQPPINAYNTQMGRSMPVNDLVTQAPANLPAPPTPPHVYGASSPTAWTRGPVVHPVYVSPITLASARGVTSDEAKAVQNTIYLMTVLQTSGVPAQREWAASRLSVLDAKAHPYVVEALMNIAKTDSAPLVRVAALRALGQMNAGTPTVMTVLDNAQRDRDPRVRDEAKNTLVVLDMKSLPVSEVQPASATTK